MNREPAKSRKEKDAEYFKNMADLKYGMNTGAKLSMDQVSKALSDTLVGLKRNTELEHKYASVKKMLDLTVERMGELEGELPMQFMSMDKTGGNDAKGTD